MSTIFILHSWQFSVFKWTFMNINISCHQFSLDSWKICYTEKLFKSSIIFKTLKPSVKRLVSGSVWDCGIICTAVTVTKTFFEKKDTHSPPNRPVKLWKWSCEIFQIDDKGKHDILGLWCKSGWSLCDWVAWDLTGHRCTVTHCQLTSS